MQYAISDPRMVSARVFDDEIVVANFATGIYYSLMGSAAEIWSALMAGIPVERIAETLGKQSRASSEQFAEAAKAFVRTLEAENLIKPTSAVSDQSWQPRNQDVSYDLPTFERFTDMQDLLLLDPVHDVSDAGWPHAEPDKSN